ncbi:dienelactone hydrolase family protein [Microcoleus sp. FACHB-1515]|uniref:dienelactone hydrolase family protein n=1 Tax=Cyanophyceae TaxID=3028117 RepID=UPI001682908B|nr:dienelactone hydrolase family protein [Microcoleus sp. FACHB-1515]MBD2088942.1 dienelactone hydrolase family protein [Microcoleus sp. FACHB-1515]
MTLQIRSNLTQIHSGDLAIDAYLAIPETDQKVPAIVVIQEIFGVNAHIRNVCDRIAKLGYVAIAPAIYQRLAPRYETGYSEADVKQGRIYKEQTKVDELLSDIQAAIDYVKTLPQVEPDRIGCIGFCFGGHVAYLAATLPDIKATASFYGAGIPNWSPGGGTATIERTAEIKGKLYAFFGADDASIPPEHVEAIRSALDRHSIEHQVFVYPKAGHGFFCEARSSYAPEAAKAAWQQVQQLFDESL